MPASPHDLYLAWNSDWSLLLALVLLGAAVTVARRRGMFTLGWLALVVAFVSPLCALTVVLFSARAMHHLLLLSVAAPLLGAALPQLGRRVASVWSLLAMIVALALWHVPSVYTLAWQSHSVYWLLQLGLLVPATVFWSRIFATLRGSNSESAHAVFTALAQIAALAGVMGLIGAVLTFAPSVLYLEHGWQPTLYGLEPLQDQQLAGLLMWVPGFLPLAAIAAMVLKRAWYRQSIAHEAQVATP